MAKLLLTANNQYLFQSRIISNTNLGETAIEKDIVTQESMDVLRESINSLPYKYREVLTLRFLEEKDYNESDEHSLMMNLHEKQALFFSKHYMEHKCEIKEK